MDQPALQQWWQVKLVPVLQHCNTTYRHNKQSNKRQGMWYRFPHTCIPPPPPFTIPSLLLCHSPYSSRMHIIKHSLIRTKAAPRKGWRLPFEFWIDLLHPHQTYPCLHIWRIPPPFNRKQQQAAQNDTRVLHGSLGSCQVKRRTYVRVRAMDSKQLAPPTLGWPRSTKQARPTAAAHLLHTFDQSTTRLSPTWCILAVFKAAIDPYTCRVRLKRYFRYFAGKDQHIR